MTDKAIRNGLSGERQCFDLPVPAIGKAFAILDYLAGSTEPKSLTEIAGSLLIPKTSAFSLLNSLCALGVLRKVEGGLYAPSIRLYTLGVAARISIAHNHELIQCLNQLRDEIGHTVFFSLYDDGELVVWEKVEGFESVLFKAYTGERKRLNTSSAGKAIAAYLSNVELEKAISMGMDIRTENSIVGREAFITHLEQIRACGYAIDDEEGERGIFCIGVPVFDASGKVFGAVSMSALKSRIAPGDIPNYTAALKRTADRVSTVM